MGFVAVGTPYANVGAVLVLASLRVLIVEGGEVWSGALVARREPGFACIGCVAPFEAGGTLPGGRRDGPRLALSYNANE